jgi:hypothetical protein
MFGSDGLLSLIDTHSFSNMWFWIGLAVLWSNLTHHLLGVPFDMVQRARKSGGQAMTDLEELTAIQLRRRLHLMQRGGVWIVGIWAAFLTVLVVLAVQYRLEVAQAFAFLLIPATLAMVLSALFALKLERLSPKGEDLCRRLTWHRVLLQAVGLGAIFVTAIYGMLFNLSVTVLGG